MISSRHVLELWMTVSVPIGSPNPNPTISRQVLSSDIETAGNFSPIASLKPSSTLFETCLAPRAVQQQLLYTNIHVLRLTRLPEQGCSWKMVSAVSRKYTFLTALLVCTFVAVSVQGQGSAGEYYTKQVPEIVVGIWTRPRTYFYRISGVSSISNILS